MAVIGIILLIGIVKKNGIMMVDFALAAEREQGKDPVTAIYEACLLRFRPIMMTTFAALLGALPLALGTGVGVRAAPAPGRHHRRRPGGEPGADALHHAGHLPLFRPACRSSWPDRGPGAGDRPGGWPAMSLPAICIRRPAGTFLLTAALVLAGAIAFRLLPVAPLPQVDFPTISVQAQLPGAEPITMATAVAAPLERQFGRIAGGDGDDPRPVPWVRPASRSSSTCPGTSTARPGTSRPPSTPPGATCRRPCGRTPPTARSTRPTRPSSFWG